MAANKKIVLAKTPQKKVAVISHERSGTHFLMNSIAGNFNYISKPWWNFDFELGLNFHASHAIKTYLAQVNGKPVMNILKSHHQAGFFTDVIDDISQEFHIFYIYRDPRDTLISFSKLIKSFPWNEGPHIDSDYDFMFSQPAGHLIRYQKHQCPNMLQRWKTHVEGWVNLAEEKPHLDITLVSYEQLYAHFDATLQTQAQRLGVAPKDNYLRPDTNKQVIGSGTGGFNKYRQKLNTLQITAVNIELSNILQRLNYE